MTDDFNNWNITGTGQTGSGTPNSGNPNSPWYTDPNLWLQVLNTGADAYISQNSAHTANRTNIQLARENREWEKMLSDTAVQRRANDIEKAGGNRALAFTSGQSASTPSSSAPTVEPTFRPGGLAGLNAAALVAANVANVRADTANKTASARIQNVEANIRESNQFQETATRLEQLTEEEKWPAIKTEILKSQESATAADAKRKNDTVDQMIALAKQQVATGKINLDALTNIANVGGIEAGKALPFLKLVIDSAMRFFHK